MHTRSLPLSMNEPLIMRWQPEARAPWLLARVLLLVYASSSREILAPPFHVLLLNRVLRCNRGPVPAAPPDQVRHACNPSQLVGVDQTLLCGGRQSFCLCTSLARWNLPHCPVRRYFTHLTHRNQRQVEVCSFVKAFILRSLR